MATVEFLRKRIDGKKAELEKLNKKLARIQKAKDSNWEVNPYYYDESDLKYTLRDIELTTKALDDYTAELERSAKKDSSRNVQVIIDFLEMWKKRVFSFYEAAIKEYFDESKHVRELYARTSSGRYYSDSETEEYKQYEEARIALFSKANGYYEKKAYTNRRGKPDTHEVKIRGGELEYAKDYINRGSYDEAISRLNKDLEAEAKRKYDFIIERTCAIVGTITDASNLKIGAKGDLNGYIIGTNGTASVNTIGAGGYNVQVFHFRTLIHKM